MDSLATATSPPIRPLVAIACLFIKLYQIAIAPLLGAHCRFAPSCSHYAAEALHRHGVLRGAALAARRIVRCHPWHAGGWDPVP